MLAVESLSCLWGSSGLATMTFCIACESVVDSGWCFASGFCFLQSP